jgi:hypothetical protein
MELTIQIGIDANRVSKDLWARLHRHFTEPQIVEPVFSGIRPILEVSE